MKRAMLLLAVMFCLTGALFAQTTINGSLRGRVTDANNAVIANTQLNLINQETSQQLITMTDASGAYFFARVVPGRYELLIKNAGFQAQRRELVIGINDVAIANLTLNVGQVGEAVTITGGTEIVRSQSSDVAMLVTEQRVRELPLNGKNFQRLVLLAPGVAGGNANNPSISGARPLTNTYTVDGVSANDERAAGGLALDGGGAAGLSVAAPNLISTEAVQEFNIITSNADATFGRGSGGQINLITKAGTNAWHGSAYEYLRNDVFDARDFFNQGPFRDTQGRAVVPPFKQNLFSGSLGGRSSKIGISSLAITKAFGSGWNVRQQRQCRMAI
jgi:hypothetical protein